MKKKYIFCSLMTISMMFFTASSQNMVLTKEPYWVVESNLKTPKHSIIYFYTQENILMHKQTVSGKKLKANNIKVQRKLNKILQEINTAWQKENIIIDSVVIANRF